MGLQLKYTCKLKNISPRSRIPSVCREAVVELIHVIYAVSASSTFPHAISLWSFTKKLCSSKIRFPEAEPSPSMYVCGELTLPWKLYHNDLCCVNSETETPQFSCEKPSQQPDFINVLQPGRDICHSWTGNREKEVFVAQNDLFFHLGPYFWAWVWNSFCAYKSFLMFYAYYK